MFQSFMNTVLGLSKDELGPYNKEWWTEEEHQLRSKIEELGIGYGGWEEHHNSKLNKFEYRLTQQSIEKVQPLLGKYIGTATNQEDYNWNNLHSCPKCLINKFQHRKHESGWKELFSDDDEVDKWEICENLSEGFGVEIMIDMEGQPGLLHRYDHILPTDEYQCPECEETFDFPNNPYEECGELETVSVFENGCVAWGHYGRGGALEVRYHKNNLNYPGDEQLFLEMMDEELNQQ